MLLVLLEWLMAWSFLEHPWRAARAARGAATSLTITHGHLGASQGGSVLAQVMRLCQEAEAEAAHLGHTGED